jgi:hypothetical protein
MKDRECDPRAMAIRADARAAGLVTAHTTRVAAPWSTMRTRVVGIAPGTESTSDGTATVRVRNLYDESVNEVRSVRSFRGERVSTRAARATVARQATEVERSGLVNNIGQDYS